MGAHMGWQRHYVPCGFAPLVAVAVACNSGCSSPSPLPSYAVSHQPSSERFKTMPYVVADSAPTGFIHLTSSDRDNYETWRKIQNSRRDEEIDRANQEGTATMARDCIIRTLIILSPF